MRWRFAPPYQKKEGKMEFTAHKTEDGKIQSVKEHLEGTARLAEEFSAGRLTKLAETAALLHDIGKYSGAFQQHINGSPTRVEHSVCGAKECKALFPKNSLSAPLLEYCIAGHHSGLPDGGSAADSEDMPTLSARMKRKGEDYSAYKEELEIALPDERELMELLKKAGSKEELTELYCFFTRYVFSCLTDADFIDTERFCSGKLSRGGKGDFEKALAAVEEKLNSFKADTKVKKARRELLLQAVENAESLSGINILNMPTGSGKTLCSLDIALRTAVKEKKKRIIYVIPYTSIIEQTAEIFEDIFGDRVDILQHHSNFIPDSDDENRGTAEKIKRNCENWDSPFIITTTVQFFESLYHYKGSRLRKLHNMADSVIVFDEAHLLPLKYLKPCIRGVGFLTEYFGCKALFLSATMPDYKPLFREFLPNVQVKELITDKSSFEAFRNCGYVNMGEKDYEAIAAEAERYDSALIVVNTRKAAHKVYDLLGGRKFHLSTYMTPEHRSEVIGQIKELLGKEKITVVSTSLVEAGVDLDFEAVFRELAGLDNILQAGGRCNREGKRDNGRVFVFETENRLKGDMGIRANIAKSLLERDITSPEVIEDYYSRIFDFNHRLIGENSIYRMAGDTGLYSLPFRKYAEGFELIGADTRGIVIPRDEKSKELVQRLEYGEMSVMRALQRYSVSVYGYQLDEILKMGIVREINGVLVLEDMSRYSDKKGFVYSESCDDNYIMC